MNLYTENLLDIERILEILEEQVLQHTGRNLLKSEIAVIKGSWDGKDYKQIASDYGYNAHYLHKTVGPQLWKILSEAIGKGVEIKKTNSKNILIELVKKDYLTRLEISESDNNSLIGKVKFCGDPPEIVSFHGREEDIHYLKNQIILFKQRCVCITGVGGIGKSLLVTKLIEEILLENPDRYDYVIWKRVEPSSSISEIVTDLIKIFHAEYEEDKSFKDKIFLVSKIFSSYKCLLVIDGFEALVQTGNFGNQADFEDFFNGITKEQYLSCAIITSQLPLKEFAYAIVKLPVLYLKLEGLDTNAAIEMLRKKGLRGKECKELIETYRANPSDLEAVAEKINRYFGGSIQRFLEYKTTVMGTQFQLMLHLQFGNPGFLSKLQRKILIYLAEQTAVNQTAVLFSTLVKYLKEQFGEVSISGIMTEIEVLEQRSLIETSNELSKQEVSYSLQPVVRKYILIDPLGLVYETSGKTRLNNWMEAG
ncbi:NB-ARC domain-containing protein [aff. Roholtiella sp. LEGE 12411]|uniref:NB-ARC domain-containing protein n=1 Tax=aff. Roholtiella sp. LEGE 12411 TaxID=1828822 RepID=UPI0018811DA1|nr:NB-ARC domain-containing protein [aff. Roholtiella sp. LEGE 12411]MBE9038879.1 NACHT domain-containing protein [aff. Roholtiella sp. LEGE 12411]